MLPFLGLSEERWWHEMQGKTHRVGGVLSTVIACSVMQDGGYSLGEVNQLLQMAVVYPFALYGSVLPDLDHGWNSAPAKDLVSFVINKVLHLTSGLRTKSGKSLPVLGIFDARHRSWQTHSVLLFAALGAVWWWLGKVGTAGVDGIMLNLMLFGLTLGIASHLLLDMLTPEGIWLLLPSAVMRKPVKLRLVPAKPFFASGGSWEKLVRVLMWVAIAVFLLKIAYIASPYRLEFNFGG